MTRSPTPQPESTPMKLASLPAVGQPLEGGLFAGVTTHQGTHCAVVLLPDRPPKRMTWQEATEWAAGVGGQLPTRPVGALLFAGVRGEFEQAWYWTAEEVDGYASYAWGQSFTHGSQSFYHKSSQERARSVRLIHLVD